VFGFKSVRHPKTPQHAAPALPSQSVDIHTISWKNAPHDGKIFNISWLGQELVGGSSTKNLLPKAIIGTILSHGTSRDGHS
jgi:hypothetical protein